MTDAVYYHPEKLAAFVRGWREDAGLTAEQAADRLEMSVKTFRHIEYGRGFRYPKLLLAAIRQEKIAASLARRPIAHDAGRAHTRASTPAKSTSSSRKPASRNIAK